MEPQQRLPAGKSVGGVVGSGGKLREGIDRETGITAKGLHTDLAFMAVEITGDEMYFSVFSRSGQIINSGGFTRRKIIS
jgi:hypothetical protein